MKLPFFRSGSPDRIGNTTTQASVGSLRPGQAAAAKFRARKRKNLPKRGFSGLIVAPKNTSAPTASAPKVSSLKKGSKLKRAIKMKNVGAVLVILIALASLGAYGYQSKAWVVQDVEVNGNINILHDSIAELQKQLRGENLLTLDTTSYTSSLEQDPYVKNLYVEKQYPGKLVINVTEAEPYMNFYSLNTAYLLEDSGKVLSRRGLEDNYPVTEVERLIYINKLPFRSDMLKDKWLVENLAKQRDLFLEEQASQVEGESTKVTQTEKEEQKLFERFVDKSFEEADLNSLTKYYNQLRSEVISTIEGRWLSTEEKVSPEESKFVVYSLIELNEINGFDELIANKYFVNLADQVEDTYVIERMEMISPITVRLKVKSTDGREVYILFSTKKSLERQFIELNTITNKLAENDQKFEKIDLTGDKVVVQY